MSYKYVEFIGVPLPLLNYVQDHDVMPAASTLQDSIGSAWDWLGTRRRTGRRQAFTLTGTYYGDKTYLVDHQGNRIVDEQGNYLLAGDSKQMLHSQLSALLALKGQRGNLWRVRQADGVRQWKTARLLEISWQRASHRNSHIAEVRCQFETRTEFWHSATVTTTSVNTTNRVTAGLTVSNLGEEPVRNALLYVEPVSGSITDVRVQVLALGVDFSWTGSTGSRLNINCANKTVKIGSQDVYSGMTFNSGHTADDWLPLAAGDNALLVTVTGANAVAAVQHYNQFA